MDDDPLAEPAPCDECAGRCRCRKCHGAGWVQVLPSYAAHLAPDPDPLVLAQLPEGQQAVLLERVRVRRVALADSWYPCRECNLPLFMRWVEGHWKVDHDVTTCADCIDALGGRRRARAVAAHTPSRRDLE